LHKEFRQFFRDPVLLFLVLWLYTAEAMICALTLTFDLNDVPVAVLDLDRSVASRRLADRLDRSAAFEVRLRPGDDREIRPLAARAVLELGGTDPASVDLEALRLDLDRIIQLYRRRGGARWTDAVLETARRHGIRLPRSIILYAKATILNESLVTELDPEFQVMPVVQRMVVPILQQEVKAFAGRLRRDLPDMTTRYAEMLRDLPTMIQDYLSTKLENET
jgi:hypothetical protein